MEQDISKYSNETLIFLLETDIKVRRELQDQIREELTTRELSEIDIRSLIGNNEGINRQIQSNIDNNLSIEQNISQIVELGIDENIAKIVIEQKTNKYEFPKLVIIWLSLIAVGQVLNFSSLLSIQSSESMLFPILSSAGLLLSIFFIFNKKKWAMFLFIACLISYVVIGFQYDLLKMVAQGVLHLFISLFAFNAKRNDKYFWE